MKKIIITTSLIFIFSVMLANNDGDKMTFNSPITTIEFNINDLKPMIPIEASFEEIIDTINIENLKPIIPIEADFEM